MSKTSTKQAPVDQRAESVTMIPIADVHPSPANERKSLGDLGELVESIKSVGILEPLIVVPVDHGYEVVVGHRRRGAGVLAELKWLPCIVRSYDVTQRTVARLVENLQRADLAPFEEAAGFQQLVDQGLTQRDIATRVGRSQASISKRLALLKLPADAASYIASGNLTLDDAAQLGAVDDPELMAAAMEGIKQASKGSWPWTIRHLDQLRARLDRDRKVRAATEKLRAEKVSILHGRPDPWNSSMAALGTGYRGLPMKVKEHASHPCHAAYVDEHSGEVSYWCTKPANHVKADDKKVAAAAAKASETGGNRSERSEESKAKAHETRERNKTLRARQPLRTAALKAAIANDRAMLTFTLRQLVQTVLAHASGAAGLAAELLDVDRKATGFQWGAYLSGAKGDDRLLKLAYVLALALGEHPLAELPKRGFFDSEFTSHTFRYFDRLKFAADYQPDKVERDSVRKAAGGWHVAVGFDKGWDAGGPDGDAPISDESVDEEAGEPAPPKASASPASDKAASSSGGSVETASQRMERERRAKIDAAKRQLEEVEPLKPGSPSAPGTCTVCGCHGDCEGGCSWVVVDDGFWQCSTHATADALA
jgi:ParB/RepB/Spo0J family partition protein